MTRIKKKYSTLYFAYLPVDVVALLSGVCNVLVVAVDVIGIEFVDDTTKIGPENIFWLMFLIDLR